MTTTNNYGLKKPAATDNYNIDDFNSNVDVIDNQMKINAERSEALEEKAVAYLTHQKSGNSHVFTGLENRTGNVMAVFTSAGNYDAGDSASIDGAVYSFKAVGGNLKSGIFQNGDKVSVLISVSEKKIYLQGIPSPEAVGAETSGAIASHNSSGTSHNDIRTQIKNIDPNYTLIHSKSGTVHEITGVNGKTGLLSCKFKASLGYSKGDTFTVDGTSYTGKLQSDDELYNNFFIAGAVVSCVLDTENHTINFKSSGGSVKYASGTVTNGSTTQEMVVSGLDFRPNAITIFASAGMSSDYLNYAHHIEYQSGHSRYGTWRTLSGKLVETVDSSDVIVEINAYGFRVYLNPSLNRFGAFSYTWIAWRGVE